MSHEPVSTANAVHYRWGGPARDQSDGWHLVRTHELSIIEESMPPGASEVLHYHARSRQFFYVLEGVLTIKMDGEPVVLRPGQGIGIAQGESHQALNVSQAAVRFLVISQPASHGDRVEAS